MSAIVTKSQLSKEDQQLLKQIVQKLYGDALDSGESKKYTIQLKSGTVNVYIVPLQIEPSVCQGAIRA